MPIDIDAANPVGTMQVSDFPGNEQSSRTAVENALKKEHSYTPGGIAENDCVHTFGIGNDATRDGAANQALWINNPGCIWFNTETGETLLQMYDGTAPYDNTKWTTVPLEILKMSNQWEKNQWGLWQELTPSGGAVTPDWSSGHAFYVDPITAQLTINNPTNLPDTGVGGELEFQTAILYLKHDAAGTPHNLIFGGLYIAPLDIKPVLTGANAIDILSMTLLPDGDILVLPAYGVGNTGW